MATEEKAKPKAIKLTLPDDAALAAARAERKAAGQANTLPAGTVLGLPDGFVAAKLDPSLDEGRKAELRAKWRSRGWVELEGLHQVLGYPLGAHVFVKKQADFDADRAERDRSLKEAAKSGLFLFGQA